MRIKYLLTFHYIVAFFLTIYGQGSVNPNYHHVQGYYRKDGTYVKPHIRTNPNSTNSDNYSTVGNTNPWTGKPGWILSDNMPSNESGGSSRNFNVSTTNVKIPSPASNWRDISDYSSFKKSENSINYTPRTFPNYADNYAPSSTFENNTFYSSGKKTIYYSDGKEVFNVLATSKTRFNKNSTYYFYVPKLDKVLSLKGGAYGQLLDGRYQMFLDDGTLLYESNFKQGLYHGAHTVYDVDGNEKLKVIYEEGEVVGFRGFNDEDELVEWIGKPFTYNSIRTFKKNGIVNCKEEYKNADSYKVTIYNEKNGKRVSEFNIENHLGSVEFKHYHDDGNIISRRGFILDDELNGEIKDYTENGKLISTTSYLKGIKNGHFELYSPDGYIIEKGYFKNDLLDGIIEINNYDDGVSEKIFYSSGRRNGLYEKREGGVLLIKGLYVNDEPHGRWEYFIKNEESKKTYLAAYFTFENGIRNGNFREIKRDTIFIGAFKNGNIHGRLKIYRPILLWYFGIIPQDVQEIDLIAEGDMSDGKKVGMWKFYDEAHNLKKEGQYLNDQMHGLWKYYYPKILDIDGNESKEVDYSGKLYLTENYLKGLLNGRSERYSYLEEVQTMCDTSIGTVNPLDTCYKLNWIKRHEIIYYKNGVNHGPIEFSDSLGIVLRGSFNNGKKNDLWIYRLDSGMILRGYYLDDKKISTWKTIAHGDKVIDEVAYKSGLRDGVSTEYDLLGNKSIQAIYSKGKIQHVLKYDTISGKIIEEFKEINYSNGECKFTYIFPRNDSIFSFSLEIQPVLSTEETDQSYFISDIEHVSKNLNGPSTITNSKGRPLVSGNYSNSKKSGNWIYYYYQQKVKRMIIFENDKRKSDFFRIIPSNEPFSGIFEAYAHNNKIRAKIQVKNGLRHGKTIVYGSDGGIEKIKKYKKGILVKGVE
jgi:antitoxin component YwqK of YwqJK toxin-antitoxin module